MDQSPLDALRHLNEQTGLSRDGLPPEPVELFHSWLEQAETAGIHLPNAMVVATVGLDGAPSARTVLLKTADASGLIFYTNYKSRKGRELGQNPKAAAVIVWTPLSRQIRVTGSVAKLEDAASDAYFASRPRGSQIEAWASPQSETIPNRAWLESRFQQEESRFTEGSIPRPPHWGGFRLQPVTFEFWQGRPDRMHDRVVYSRESAGWKVSRLAP